MQIRAMTSEAQDIPQFLHSIFSSPDLGSGAKENKCKRFCSYYRTLDTNSRAAFLSHLAQQYSYNLDTVVQGASHLVSSQERGEAFMVKSLERLRSVMTPRYQTLFQQIGHFDWGVKFLVDMRADVLNAITNSMGELDTANFHALSRHLKELFSLWFAVGFFDLERVTWTSPCDVVQKISDYEAVHPIRSWTDLRQRVGSYRRCYVFTHHCMPREPIVVLHTALTSEISNNIHNIIHNPRFRANTAESQFQQQQQQNLSSLEDEEDPSQITTAVFYSITSTQKGLQGVELGNYLIKSVVRRLQSEFPHLAQFSSFSPIPGFRDWLIGHINTQLNSAGSDGNSSSQQLLTAAEMQSLRALQQQSDSSVLETFKQLVQQSNSWLPDADKVLMMKGILLRLCARYLYLEKRRGLALNPVANFHLTNGAVLWRINFLADTSIRGLNQSCGLMVNYRYYLDDTESNSQNYLLHHRISASPAVLELLQHDLPTGSQNGES